jgi:hypothetical protein
MYECKSGFLIHSRQSRMISRRANPGLPMAIRRRARNEWLLSWKLIVPAYLFLGVLEAAAAMAVFFIILNTAGWVYGETLAHSTPLYLLMMPFFIDTSAGNWLFGTVPVGGEWLLALALAVFMGGLDEIRKAWLRRASA